MTISITEAYKEFGIPRATLYRKIKEGGVSTVIMRNGKKGLEPSELVRVFGEPKTKTQHENPTGNLVDVLRQEKDGRDSHPDGLFSQLIQSLRDRLTEKDDRIHSQEQTITDLRTRLDRSEQDKTIALRLLEDKREPPQGRNKKQEKHTGKGKPKRRK